MNEAYIYKMECLLNLMRLTTIGIENDLKVNEADPEEIASALDTIRYRMADLLDEAREANERRKLMVKEA